MIKLADSDGYTYNVKIRRANATYWQCTVRPRDNGCKAIAIQRGDVFTAGNQSYNYPPIAGLATAAKIMACVKERAVEDQFKSTSVIVYELRI